MPFPHLIKAQRNKEPFDGAAQRNAKAQRQGGVGKSLKAGKCPGVENR